MKSETQAFMASSMLKGTTYLLYGILDYIHTSIPIKWHYSETPVHVRYVPLILITHFTTAGYHGKHEQQSCQWLNKCCILAQKHTNRTTEELFVLLMHFNFSNIIYNFVTFQLIKEIESYNLLLPLILSHHENYMRQHIVSLFRN
jgi:hypothetical protein